MKFTKHEERQITVKYVSVEMAVRYDEEDIPNDFPLRKGDMWSAIIEADTGRILDWPIGHSGIVAMKVCDEGTYRLLDADKHVVAEIENDYVPNGLIPGEYGDYCDLRIDENGIITNWPKYPDLSAFEAASGRD